MVAAGFSEDSGSGEAEGTIWRRDSGSSTGTECLPGPPDLQNNNGIRTGARVTLGVSWFLVLERGNATLMDVQAVVLRIRGGSSED